MKRGGPLRRTNGLARGTGNGRGRAPDPAARVNARCEVCGAKFVRVRSQVEHRGAARFCSRQCQTVGSRTRPTAECEVCGTSFVIAREDPRRGKFCSRACYDLNRTTNTTRVELVCACGKTFTRPKAWVRQGRSKSCSKECAARARYKGTGGARGLGWKKIAAAVRESDQNQCVRCGSEQSERELSVDHVIPWRMWKDQKAANDRRNLRSLCDRCHGIKTSVIEPKLEKGAWLSLKTFYGEEVAEAAMALFFESEYV